MRLTPPSAALVNGTASHALDYDDANMAMLGHPSVPLFGALLSLAEARHASGRQLITAFVAGYETECRLGRAVGRSHYQLGFHATGTIGAIGAAAACARLLDLDSVSAALAIGLAATQAAGLKCMFGTMAKPLHAGRAAASGLLAARLAARGFTANSQAIEAQQGLASTMGGSLAPERASDSGDRWFLRQNLFKYHASCLETHSTIEGIRELRLADGFAAEMIDRIVVHANALQLGMCAIPEPTTGLEAKFSLRHLAAAAAQGIDTSAIGSFTDQVVTEPGVLEMRQRVEVVEDGPTSGGTPVEIWLSDGRRLATAHDIHRPATDLVAQRRRLEEKARALAEPVVGPARTEQLLNGARAVTEYDDVGDLTTLTSTG
jgi:2-methylcitrate dehydratase PrpD